MVRLYGTLGPACGSVPVLQQLFEAGMAGVRLNLSHSGLRECGEWTGNLFKAAKAKEVSPELIIDMQGPELRIGNLGGPVILREGETFRFGKDDIPVPERIFPLMKEKQEVLLDDGKILAEVVSVDGSSSTCRTLRGGILKPHKSISLAGADRTNIVLTDEDLENLKLAKKYGVTGIMQPFVQSGDDLLQLREILKQRDLGELKIYAKLENMEGVKALGEIIPYADEIVIARGDLGNSMPLWKLPGVQKDIAGICTRWGMPFMVATQMLYTMENSAVPTRAEVCDIFNAVLDGADSLIITGETAVGSYPVEAMRYLSLTAKEAYEYKARHKTNNLH